MKIQDKTTKIIFNVLAIVCIIIFCFSLTPRTLQNDTYYTIKIGELITNNGIDMKDHFSWHEDLPYTYPHWAYDTGMYLVYHLGEISGLPDGGMLFVYLSTVVLTSILGISLYYTSQKLTKNKLVSFVISMACMYLLRDYIAARAQLVTFILFVLTILCIESFLETKKKRYLIAIIAISIAIANIHVAVWPFFFVLFLPYIAEYIIAAIAEKNLLQRFIVFNKKDVVKTLEKKLAKAKNEEEASKIQKLINEKKEEVAQEEVRFEKIKVRTKELRDNPYKIKVTKNSAVKWLILVMVICAFTGLLTPLGDTPYTYLIKTMQGNTTQSISEHLPLTLYNDKSTMIVLALFLIILVFTDTRIKLSDLFMLAGLVYLSFMSRRQISLLVLIGGFVFAKLLTSLVEKYDSDGCRNVTNFMTTILGRTITLAVVIILAFSMYKPKMNNSFVSSSSYPVDAATWMLENLDVENIKLFNEYNYGSYLLFRGIPVFIDSRADLYAPEFNGTKDENGEYKGRDIFSDYINTSSIGTYYETKFEEYGITHVIVTKNSKLNMFISKNEKYKELYNDGKFVIYERDV